MFFSLCVCLSDCVLISKRDMTHIIEYENRSNTSELVKLVIVTENEEGINAI